MIDFTKLCRKVPDPPRSVTPRSKSGYERYLGNCAPLQSARRLVALEGWAEYAGDSASMLPHIWE